MSDRFGEAMDHFLIVVVAVAVVLLLVVMLGSRQSPFRHKISRILPQNPNEKRTPLEFNREYYTTGERNMRRPNRGVNPSRTVLAVLVQKVDERRRTMDPSGTMKLYNEYYELIFKTRKNEIIHIVTSKNAYLESPFHQQGQLTFQGDQLIRFQYSGGEVIEDPHAFHTASLLNAAPTNRR